MSEDLLLPAPNRTHSEAKFTASINEGGRASSLCPRMDPFPSYRASGRRFHSLKHFLSALEDLRHLEYFQSQVYTS